jgi:DnaJ-class molecular chaperone
MSNQSDVQIPRKPSESERSSFLDVVEQVCEDCGGTGRDVGSLNPNEFEPCPTCHGSGQETMLRRNVLARQEQEAESA